MSSNSSLYLFLSLFIFTFSFANNPVRLCYKVLAFLYCAFDGGRSFDSALLDFLCHFLLCKANLMFYIIINLINYMRVTLTTETKTMKNLKTFNEEINMIEKG